MHIATILAEEQICSCPNPSLAKWSFMWLGCFLIIMLFCILIIYIFSEGPLWISASLLNGPPWQNRVYFTSVYLTFKSKSAFSIYIAAPAPPRKTRGELYKDVDADYYGYRDEDDGVLVPLEQDVEKEGVVINIWLFPKCMWLKSSKILLKVSVYCEAYK